MFVEARSAKALCGGPCCPGLLASEATEWAGRTYDTGLTLIGTITRTLLDESSKRLTSGSPAWFLE